MYQVWKSTCLTPEKLCISQIPFRGVACHLIYAKNTHYAHDYCQNQYMPICMSRFGGILIKLTCICIIHLSPITNKNKQSEKKRSRTCTSLRRQQLFSLHIHLLITLNSNGAKISIFSRKGKLRKTKAKGERERKAETPTLSARRQTNYARGTERRETSGRSVTWVPVRVPFIPVLLEERNSMDQKA